MCISSKSQQITSSTPVQLGTHPVGSVSPSSTRAGSALRAATRWAADLWHSSGGLYCTREIPRVKKERSTPDEDDCLERTVGMVSLDHCREKGGAKKVSEMAWVKTLTFPWHMEMWWLIQIKVTNINEKIIWETTLGRVRGSNALHQVMMSLLVWTYFFIGRKHWVFHTATKPENSYCSTLEQAQKHLGKNLCFMQSNT